MAFSYPLPDLEQTVVELIVELLLLEREGRYPSLIFGNPEDKKAVRVTMHYVMALLSYGFEASDSELQRAAEWFDRPFPKNRGSNMVDTREMNRLMVLLQLRPDSRGVRARLEQLARQYANGYYDVQPGWPEFDTLWALEAFTEAKKVQVLDDGIVSLDYLSQRLDKLIASKDLKRDKDIALALRLQQKLVGDLTETHQEVLKELLSMAVVNDGVWGMREFGWQVNELGWYRQLVAGNTLMFDHVKEHQARFRKVVLSTCMVIECLVPLIDSHPQIREPVERAIGMWWAQFKGQNAVTTLRNLFPRPHDYDYLLVLARTVRSVREFIRQPLRSLDTVHLLRELTSFKTNTVEPLEIRNIKAALRNWVNIDLIGQPERLKLGFSEANVVRVHPYIGSPSITTDTTSQVSLAPQSLIIKYGPKDMIDSERRNYESLPAATRDYFVRIPEDTFHDPQHGVSYVIMQDLRDYRTLYEVHDGVSRNVNAVADQLGVFLQRMHEGSSGQTRYAGRSLLRELYLSRMMEYTDRIFNFVWENQLFLGSGQSEISEIQYELFERIGDIIRCQRELEKFPVAYMHGDLHMRNIMVSGLLNDVVSRPSEMTFKLIDLEFTRRDGDAAFDAGQLLVDIDLVSREERNLENHDRLTRLNDILQRSYNKFGQMRDDHYFGIRMELAKARALLRIAKGKTKRGGQYLQKDQVRHAEQISEDVIKHAAEALQHLKSVVGAISM